MKTSKANLAEGGFSSHEEDEYLNAVPTVKKVATPLPKIEIIAVCAILLVEAISTSMLFPFVGLYVAFLQNISSEAAGYYSGLLVGLFSLGQAVSCKLWGWVSDTYGRKLPLVGGLIASAIAVFFFGMSPNLFMCCLLRFIHGFLNGNVLIAKTIISDVTDETNAPLGFSMVGLMWCVGSVIGPAIGGFLYDPRGNPQLHFLHIEENSFLACNPAFLVCFCHSMYTVLVSVYCIFLLPETNKQPSKSLRHVPVLGRIVNYFHPKQVILVDVERGSTSALPHSERNLSGERMTYKRAFRDPIILVVTVLYMCISSSDMSFREVMPLWAIAAPEVGGMGMLSDKVGLIMLSFTVPTFFTTLLFPTIYKFLKTFWMWELGSALFIICMMLVPCASEMSTTGGFWFLMLTGALRNCVCSALYDLIFLLTARASPPGTVGAVNGISQSMALFTRCIVPFAMAPTFAWSISGNHVFPFNHYFVFFISVIPLGYAMFLAVGYPLERTPEGPMNSPCSELVGEHEGFSAAQDCSWSLGKELHIESSNAPVKEIEMTRNRIGGSTMEICVLEEDDRADEKEEVISSRFNAAQEEKECL